jgi:hypothetical protein
VPVVEERVLPKVAEPVTTGATVLTGAVPATIDVEFEAAETPEGATELVAVTIQRTVKL